MKLMTRIFSIALLCYCAAAAMVYFRQDQLLFHPRPFPGNFDPQAFKPSEYTVKHQDIKLHGWLLHFKPITTQTPLVIYYGGNAEEMSKQLVDRNKWGAGALLLMNYRGYGDSTGKPSADNLKSDALFIFDQLLKETSIDKKDIVLIGRSLGSGLATYVASQRDVKRIILITPFDTMSNVAQYHYPWLPVSALLSNRFNSLELTPKIDASLLTLIASQDTVIPRRFSENLIRHWKGEKKVSHIPNSNHGSINSQPEYWHAIHAFIQQ
jgi:pimeloyl-ACP methyl ester carboxylesterase